MANAVRDKKGVMDVGSGVLASHDDNPANNSNKPTTSILGIDHTPGAKPPSYLDMMKDVKGVDVGKSFGQLLRGEEVDATVEQKAKLGVLFVAMFGMEPTHPQKSIGHGRELTYAIMATQLLESKQVTLESLIADKKQMPGGEKPTFVEKEASKLPAVGIGGHPKLGTIQFGVQEVTKKVLEGEGYGTMPESDLPKHTKLAEQIRLRREINLFQQWIRATGEFEKLNDQEPDFEALKREIRTRLRQYLARRS